MIPVTNPRPFYLNLKFLDIIEASLEFQQLISLVLLVNITGYHLHNTLSVY